ncbi:MAG: GNAT family N-acetyltransferase [Limimaricola sp.]|uniref:GNAT family N-acetyltransferase n=1 Tax=Limimaricola sp. TaxID=2211665 RepID=UPI001D8ADF61|nr:GNAT family N-acetyltransferase [Limimaricola sp.]MBI1417589.1 GNAT family N-acetyltransferase [Limimaricola sp.]
MAKPVSPKVLPYPVRPTASPAIVQRGVKRRRAAARTNPRAQGLTMPPVIETAHLVMGPCTPADAEAFMDFCATDRSRFLGGPSGRADAWRSVAIHVGQWQLRGYGNWWLTDRATGKPAGRVGLWHPEGLVEPELSWVIYEGFEGKGYAAEAARAARDWAYANLGLTTLISLIDAENTRSIRLAQRLGARPDGVHTYDHGGTVTIWRHPGPGASE